MPASLKLFWGLGVQSSKSRIANMAISVNFYFYFYLIYILNNNNNNNNKYMAIKVWKNFHTIQTW